MHAGGGRRASRRLRTARTPTTSTSAHRRDPPPPLCRRSRTYPTSRRPRVPTTPPRLAAGVYNRPPDATGRSTRWSMRGRSCGTRPRRLTREVEAIRAFYSQTATWVSRRSSWPPTTPDRGNRGRCPRARRWRSSPGTAPDLRTAQPRRSRSTSPRSTRTDPNLQYIGMAREPNGLDVDGHEEAQARNRPATVHRPRRGRGRGGNLNGRHARGRREATRRARKEEARKAREAARKPEPRLGRSALPRLRRRRPGGGRGHLVHPAGRTGPGKIAEAAVTAASAASARRSDALGRRPGRGAPPAGQRPSYDQHPATSGIHDPRPCPQLPPSTPSPSTKPRPSTSWSMRA